MERTASDVLRTAAILPFKPDYETCKKHGQWQRTAQNGAGVEVTIAMSCPACGREKRLGALMERAAIPPRFVGRSLDGYEVTLQQQADMIATAREYAEGFEVGALKTGRSLIFTGMPGTGKSHVAIAIAHAVMGAGHGAIYATAGEIIRRVRATWRKTSKHDESDVYRELSLVPLLIIDEVGVQYGTEGEQIIMFEVINQRYENMRPTLILTNLPIKAPEGSSSMSLAGYLGDRVIDRLREGGGGVVVFNWESYRRNI